MVRQFSLLLLLLSLLPLASLVAQTEARDSLLIDLGDNLSPPPWNNLVDPAAGAITGLRNTRGFSTSYAIAVTDSFNNINRDGTQDPDPSLDLPATASGDSFFGNVGAFGGRTQPTAAVTLSALLPDKSYHLTLFASRTATDNREARYILTGATRDTLDLNAASNSTRTVMTTMLPAADGTIVVEAGPGPNNDNGAKFYYLGAVVVSYEMEEPPPAGEVEADTFLIDFGTVASPTPPWNNVTDFDSGAVITLANQVGTLTQVSLAVVDSFGGVNTAGTPTPDEALGFPATATGDSFFGNTSPFNGKTQETGAVALRGLDPRIGYTLRIFASRAATDNREASYTVAGITVDTVYLDASGNTGELAEVTVFPAGDSTITITVGPGPNNNNGSGFYYLGAMEVYRQAGSTAPLDTVLVDFGGTNTTPPPYNNITDPSAGVVADLTNTSGFFTGYSIAVVDSFNNVNADGTVSPEEGLDLAPTATGDSFFGNTSEFGGQIQPTGAVALDKLDPQVTYTVELFASRTTDEFRQTQYIVEGTTTDTLYLNVSSNRSTTVSTRVQPDGEGRILITASSGPNNQNNLGFYYLGVLRLIYPNMSPAGETSLTLTDPNGGEFWQAGKTTDITWVARNLRSVGLEYSTDNGTNWTVIDTVPAIDGTYPWTLPTVDTDAALVRITSDSLQDTSDDTFTISTDTTTCTIVVIGSSTAAGTGASMPDSSWVGRYVDYLSDDTRYEVVNLALGGYNTYRLLPTGSVIPPGVNMTPDVERNVTAALTYDPFAIIVNLPSNDAAEGYGVDEQLANFATIVSTATAEGVMVYVSTTQPRNFTDAGRLQLQMEVRDSILNIYGDKAVDFWTGTATETGFIIDSLDSGDGIHLNDAGHRLLFERVRELGLDTMDCSGPNALREMPKRVTGLVKAYPNPAVQGFLMLNFGDALPGTADVQIVDMLGRIRLTDRLPLTGESEQRLNVSQLGGSGGGYYYLVVTVERSGTILREILPVVIR